MATYTVSIIGTAGRKASLKNLSSTLYNKMLKRAEEIIDSLNIAKEEILLVSGGAAWSDHVAVSLFLTGAYGGLKLYLPASFENNAYVDTGVFNWKINPGGTSNYYFRSFSSKMGRDMLKDLTLAKKSGAIFDIPKDKDRGFHGRNTLVAQSDVVIAFTWGRLEPEDGGTLDTWRKIPAEATKIHVSLSDII